MTDDRSDKLAGNLDKPSEGDEFAVDEQGTKNIRGPEGHGKHDVGADHLGAEDLAKRDGGGEGKD